MDPSLASRAGMCITSMFPPFSVSWTQKANAHEEKTPSSQKKSLAEIRRREAKASHRATTNAEGIRSRNQGDCRQVAHMNIFEEVKNAVPMQDAARLYGFTPNRAGFIRCPFHNDKTPSLKLYSRSFYCFGCGAHGSVIDFVAQLCKLEPIEAAKRINDDFRLGLPMDRPQDPEAMKERQRVAEARRLFDEWREQMLNKLDACIRIANTADFKNLSDAAALATRWRETFEYWADILLHGNLDNQIAIFRDRKEVEDLCKKVLRDTPRKSLPAA